MYTFSLYIIKAILPLVALFNKKIHLFVSGRKTVWTTLTAKLDSHTRYVWIHTASLGEFEQGLPVVKSLKKQGYKIIDSNYKTKIGEIDIIAIKDKILTFVEVKSRYDDTYGRPSEAVNKYKAKKIRDVATIFLMSNDIAYEGISFDIIEVFLSSEEINHIKSAF